LIIVNTEKNIWNKTSTYNLKDKYSEIFHRKINYDKHLDIFILEQVILKRNNDLLLKVHTFTEMFFKEVPVESLTEALKAEVLGATQIELCDNLYVGGTTPTLETIKNCKKLLKIPMMVMIRPRGGDFVYTDQEIEAMIEDINYCKKIGVKGIVTGVLDKNNQVAIEIMKMLIKKARPLDVTFHKAIDETPDPIMALEQLIELGVDNVLTSGRASTAQEGSALMNKMIKTAAGDITVMVSGKITKDNFHEIRELIPSRKYHGRIISGPLDI